MLLDCTLRDGGYINDWEFGHNNLISTYERLALSGVDIVEVGFIDDRRPFDRNRSIFPNTAAITEIYGEAKYRPKMVVGMIDYGTCSIDNVQMQEDSFLDGIRVIFKKHRMNEALDYCGQLIAKGYKVFVQMVSITSYHEEDIIAISKLINNVHPYAVSIVDTYGLLYPNTMLEYYTMLDKYVDADIAIGFHAHNNLQLAYANAITFVDQRSHKRDFVVDGTLYGMGKSAGNAPIELLAPYLNEHLSTSYDINQMLEAIEESVKTIYAESPWGYKSIFYISAEHQCHPNYVSFLSAKDNLSSQDINNILQGMERTDIRLLYDKEYAERIYREYIDGKLDDKGNAAKLKAEIGDKRVLILGPGKNIKLQEEKVKAYLDKFNPIVIAINYIPSGYPLDYVFITKRNRYQEMTDLLHEKDCKVSVIRTSDVDTRETAGYVFGREPLLEQREDIKDNSFLMLLKILHMARVKEVACAGLDGYSDSEDNYYEPSMEYQFVKKVARHLNSHIRELLRTDFKDMNVEFVTYSHYAAEDDVNSGGF